MPGVGVLSFIRRQQKAFLALKNKQIKTKKTTSKETKTK